MQNEPTLTEWESSLQSDRDLLAGLQALADRKGFNPARQANIKATKARIRDAKQNISRLKTQQA